MLIDNIFYENGITETVLGKKWKLLDPYHFSAFNAGTI